MLKTIPKRPIASLICPSAPFLVPIKAAAAAALSIHHVPNSSKKRAIDATSVKKNWTRDRNRRISADPLSSWKTAITEFRDILGTRKFNEIVGAYERLFPYFNKNDTMHLAQYLHTEHRLLRAGDRRRNDILAFTDKFVQDLQERKIPGHGAASLHLLSLYKEAEAYSRGEALWTWLQRQDEDYVTSRVYGAAIELLAYKGEKLSELEKLYVQALNRFPGTFAEYHFSPGAMLPDRSVEIAYKGLPTLLLQGILTARVLHGDWRSSYLAFDTCMRLFPTQVPPRIFEIFIFERPLREAYTVFMLACRAGIILKAKTLSQLLNRFAIELTRLSWLVQDSKSTGIVLKLIDNMTEAVYAYTAAGGKPNDLQMSCFLDALHRLLPNSYSVTIEQAQSTLGRRNLIVSTAMKIVSAFSSVTSESRVNAFNRLLLMSGKANLPQVMEKIQNDMIATEITMNDGTYRAIVLASGHLEDQRAVEKSWGDLVKHSQDIGMQLSGLDWNALAKATALAANPKYALGQLNELHRGSLGEASDALQQVQERTLGTADDSSPLVKLLDQSALEDVLQRVTAKFETIFDMVVKQEAKDLRDIPIHMMMDDHLNALPGSKDDHHQIYEELTRWPSEQHPAGELFKDKTRAQARTGYFFDELRFENWQTINYLLAIAEQHSVEREEAIERAIEAGAPIKSINSSVIDRAFAGESHERKHDEDQITHETEGHDGIDKSEAFQSLRRRILELRGYQLGHSQAGNTTGGPAEHASAEATKQL